MIQRYFTAILFLVLFLTTAFAGLYIGQSYLHSDTGQHGTHGDHWHNMFHERLQITKAQEQQLLVIENRFHAQRTALENEIYRANQQLSTAIRKDKAFSPQVQEATNKIHKTMGELQNATIKHYFQMRPVLTDEQNLKLEKMVTDALESK